MNDQSTAAQPLQPPPATVPSEPPLTLTAPAPVTAVATTAAPTIAPAVDPAALPGLDAKVEDYLGSLMSVEPRSPEFAAKATDVRTMGDLDILNFALGLEHLENVMYKQIVASGKLTGEAADLAKMFGSFEQAHVDALTKALTDAKYANIAKEGKYNFPAFDTQDNILKFLNTVEPVGVGAYTGAANKLTDKSLLGVAGSIVQVEARQLAITMALAGNKMPVSGALSESFTADEVNAKVKPLIAA